MRGAHTFKPAERETGMLKADEQESLFSAEMKQKAKKRGKKS